MDGQRFHHRAIPEPPRSPESKQAAGTGESIPAPTSIPPASASPPSITVTLTGMHSSQSPPPHTLEQFLASISARAFRFAELGLRHREDALDTVQEAMIKMLTAPGGGMDATVLGDFASADH